MDERTPAFAIPGFLPPRPQNLDAAYTHSAPDGSLRLKVWQDPETQVLHDFQVTITNQNGDILFCDFKRSHIFVELGAGNADYWLILDPGVLPVGSHQVHLNIRSFHARQICRDIHYKTIGVIVPDTPWARAGRSRYGVNLQAFQSADDLQDLVAQIIRTQQISLASGGTDASASAALQLLYGRLDVITNSIENILGGSALNPIPPNIHFSTGGIIWQTAVGNGIDSTFTVAHGLATTNVLVQAYETSELYPYGQLVDCDVYVLNSGNIQVSFGNVPEAGSIRLVIAAAGSPTGSGTTSETLLSRNVTSLVDGANLVFSHADIDRAIAVTLNGVVQVDVTFDANEVTFARAPQNGDVALLIGAAEV